MDKQINGPFFPVEVAPTPDAPRGTYKIVRWDADRNVETRAEFMAGVTESEAQAEADDCNRRLRGRCADHISYRAVRVV